MLSAPSRRPRARGTSLVEVLVTLTITAVGLLGLLSLQVRSQGWQRDSFERKAVAEMVNMLYDRMLANYPGYVLGAYRIDLPIGAAVPTAAPCVSPGSCTAVEVAQQDAAAWMAELRRRVPGAGAVMARDGNLKLNLTVASYEPSDPARIDPLCAAAGLGAPGYRCYVMEMRP